MNPSPIRHDLSLHVTDLTPKRRPRVQKNANASLYVIDGGDGLVTDFGRAKVHKYKRNLSLYMYLSPCHAHAPAMRVRTHEGVKDGFTVTDSQARQTPSLRSRCDERIIHVKITRPLDTTRPWATQRRTREVPAWHRVGATLAEYFSECQSGRAIAN